MSYNLTIQGHKEHTTPEEGQAFEQEVLEKARAFVRSLEGVHTAHASMQFTGGHSLLPEAQPATPPASA